MAKKPSGGKRDGSGRKVMHPEGMAIKVSLTIPAELVQALDRWSLAQELTRSQAATEAIRRLVRRKG